MTAVDNLVIDDLVADSGGVLGKVVTFTQNHVHIRWDDGETSRYTDEDLKAHGIARVEGAK